MRLGTLVGTWSLVVAEVSSRSIIISNGRCYRKSSICYGHSGNGLELESSDLPWVNDF